MKVKALGVEGDSLWSVSVSEDSKLRLWSNDQCVSEVPHPNSRGDVDYRVREVDGRREVDLLTACSDGVGAEGGVERRSSGCSPRRRRAGCRWNCA